ncbi:MAG: cation diffusion facilitator family transporter [Methyloceanibacter sp.]|uniref:cation diffusion facilitator family transporter n=1 Tax=Methyloceanibacter sp. TaxID=1965321 RepID=UPI003D6D5D5E
MPHEAAEERALVFALLADAGVLAIMIPVGILGGSLTLTAESIRFALMMVIEYFVYVVMWRVHRNKLLDMEFGGGKLEQIANTVTGLGMLGAAVWIAFKASAIVSGQATVGAPLGLALAAIVGALNAVINLLAWNKMRLAASDGRASVVMQGQLKARRVKLVSSTVVLVAMTVAALSTDNVVVAWADALGSVFVASFILWNGIAMLRISVPDLVDQSAGGAVRDIVERILRRNAENFNRLDGFRSRRSGRVVFVEVVLSFDAGLSIAEVSRRIELLKKALQQEIENADISILPITDAGWDLLENGACP